MPDLEKTVEQTEAKFREARKARIKELKQELSSVKRELRKLGVGKKKSKKGRK